MKKKHEGKKLSTRSESSLRSAASGFSDIVTPPLDEMLVEILSLRLAEEDHRNYIIKVTFFDQLILASSIKPIWAKTKQVDKCIAKGVMNFDPSDYEKMCLFADNPLIDQDRLCVKKRLEPLIVPSLLKRKSWDNLPLLTMELSVQRNPLNFEHQKLLREANYMRLTLVAAFNMIVPYDNSFVYTAASKTPLYNESHCGLVTFNHGREMKNRFNSRNFYPEWESQRLGDEMFTKGDEKFICKYEDIKNPDDIDLRNYMELPSSHTSVWGSFRRTLMLGNTDQWLWNQLRLYNWPLEIHLYGEHGGFSFMAFLNLFHLLYPGEDTVRLVVPLQWMNSTLMLERCGCQPLLSPNVKEPTPVTQKTSKGSRGTDSVQTAASTDVSQMYRPTGADGNSAFVLLEVKLARPLKQPVIPRHITDPELQSILTELEQQTPFKRECTARGQLDRDWQSTVRSAANSLRRVPYYGMTEFCAFNRQLSETRTRVEITTSFWQDAAVYVNNNFIVSNYIDSDDTFEEMVMIAHACLMKTTCDTLIGVDDKQDLDPVLRAARHARHLQDRSHAVDLYVQVAIEQKRNAGIWRELSTCLKDVDRSWATVCLHKAVWLKPRHPMNLVSMGCMVFDEDPDSAEPFFTAVLKFYPYWTTGWIVVNAYYLDRQQFDMADKIMEYVKQTLADLSAENIGFPRNWERELGDWWDPTPLLPGMSPYFDAADLLLRLRAFALAEVCIARALVESGESAAYFHLVALCCRLRGNVEDAICHARTGLEKYGEISFLRTLEAECLHKLKDIPGAMASFEKVGSCIGAYSILLSMPCRDPQRIRPVLVDLVRRQPCAYTWMALADDWLQRGSSSVSQDDGVPALTCALACAVQALRIDRRAARAWALLARSIKPHARRQHCRNMALACGYRMPEEKMASNTTSEESLCYSLGTVLRECRCQMCDNINIG